MSRSTLRIVPLVLALLAGCATPYGGGYAGGPGGGYGQPGDPADGRHAVGSVLDVDTRNGSLLLSADSRYGPSRIEIAFGPETRVVYRGESYDPAGIERGDRLDVELIEDRGRLYAGRIDVLRNVRDGGYGAASVLEGAVARVDPGSGMIEIATGGYGSRREYVRFDRSTRFEYRGASAQPQQLEPGDVVRVEATLRGGGLFAERVTVIGDARTR